MVIPDFHYYKPSSLKEACRILYDSSDGVPLAGGTDLLVEIKQGLRRHRDIVSLNRIQELNTIREDDDELHIGATATHNMVASSPIIHKRFPAIAEAASMIGTDQIRNTGTIGGNLCTAASCCDMAPILMCLNAMLEISGSASARTVPLTNFFVDHRRTILKKGEIITKIIVPLSRAGAGSCFEKFGLREAASISVASTAAAVEFKGDVCVDARVVIGAVAPTPKISENAGKVIIGKKKSQLSENSPILKQAGDAAAEDAIPIDDIRGSALYRQSIIKVLAERAVIISAIRANT
jgi:carbon-monoxide dehydrogenase medium subunit